jgi:hypothetical protein
VESSIDVFNIFFSVSNSFLINLFNSIFSFALILSIFKLYISSSCSFYLILNNSNSFICCCDSFNSDSSFNFSLILIFISFLISSSFATEIFAEFFI